MITSAGLKVDLPGMRAPLPNQLLTLTLEIKMTGWFEAGGEPADRFFLAPGTGT